MEWISTFILIIIGIINFAMIFLLTRNLTRPLIDLSKAANDVADGHFDVVVKSSETKDEIGIVSNAFQKMVGNIQLYILEIRNSMERESQMKEKELLMESRMREAQLMTLQAQINPHFLFNTLNAGAQLAMMEGADKTTEFIENMADFFRYNIKKMNQDATILEEIHLVDNYIYIMNVRFTGEIHFEKEVDETVLDHKVPSMILQPIVENAVFYGLEPKTGERNLNIEAYCTGKKLIVKVEDNGVGMSFDKLRTINDAMCSGVSIGDNGRGTQLGIVNVNERLRLLYGEEFGLRIFSCPNVGTTIEMVLPIIIEEV